MLDEVLNGSFLGIPEFDARLKTMTSQVLNPTTAYAFLDGAEKHINSGVFGLSFGPHMGDHWVDVPSDRHNRGANLSFTDGHAEFHRWRTPKQHMSTPANVKGDEIQDLRWMQETLPLP